jgi:hypothetical protein
MAKGWLGLPHLDPSVCGVFDDVLSWWSNVVLTNAIRMKGSASMLMLVSLEI